MCVFKVHQKVITYSRVGEAALHPGVPYLNLSFLSQTFPTSFLTLAVFSVVSSR